MDPFQDPDSFLDENADRFRQVVEDAGGRMLFAEFIWRVRFDLLQWETGIELEPSPQQILNFVLRTPGLEYEQDSQGEEFIVSGERP